MELNILKNLKYEIITASPYQFLTILFQNLKEIDRKKDEIIYLAQYILELSLLEYKMLKFPASVKACAALYIARKLLKYENSWSKELKNVFQIYDGVLRTCAKEFTELVNFGNKTILKSLRNKYMSERFLGVYKIVENFSK